MNAILPDQSAYFDHTAFFANYRRIFGSLRQKQVDGANWLLRAFDSYLAARQVTFHQLAYIWATIFHETAASFQPVKEAYYLSGSEASKEAWRKANLRYYPWYGRGYVQLTWAKNYAKVQEELGIPVRDNPELALVSTYALEILVQGMLKGWYGSPLGKWVTGPELVKYADARRSVNGVDKAAEIAGYAIVFERILGASAAAKVLKEYI